MAADREGAIDMRALQHDVVPDDSKPLFTDIVNLGKRTCSKDDD
jgi:hypothetical protein